MKIRDIITLSTSPKITELVDWNQNKGHRAATTKLYQQDWALSELYRKCGGNESIAILVLATSTANPLAL